MKILASIRRIAQKRSVSATRERLIEEVAKPLEGNSEQHLQARQWIGGMLVEDETKFAEPLQRLELVNRRPVSFFRKWCELILLVVSALAFASFLPAVREYDVATNALDGGFIDLGFSNENFYRRLLTEDLHSNELLLIGDPSKSALKQKEALWRSDPGNPAFFAEYVVQFERSNLSLPLDYFQIANRIAPDNAWFDFFAAACAGRKSVEKVKQTETEKIAKAAPLWRVLDEPKLLEALKIVRNARDKPRLQSYEELLLRQRIPLLPQDGPAEKIASIGYVAATTNRSIEFRFLSELIAARAWQLAERNDREGFRELRSDALHFVDLIMECEDVTLVNELVSIVASSTVISNLHHGAVKLGLSSETPRLERLSDAMNRFKDQRDARNKRSRPYDIVSEHGSQLAQSMGLAMVVRQTETSLQFSEADLKPGRLSDYMSQSLISVLGLWLALGICLLLVFLYRFRIPIMVRLISGRLIQILRPADWCWILAGGVILPFAFVVILSVFTPLGGNGFSLKANARGEGLFLPAAAYLALLHLILIASVMMLRWRVVRRGAAFGIHASPWLGFISIAALLVFIIGYIFIKNELVLLGLLAIAGIWILIGALRAIFGDRQMLLFRATLARGLWAPLILAMLCSVVAAFGFHRLSQYWFQRDDFMRLSAAEPEMTRYDYRVARQLRAEFRAVLKAPVD